MPAARQAWRSVARAVGGQGDDGGGSVGAGLAADGPGGAEAVDAGHLAVHQNEVEGLAGGSIDRVFAIV